MDVVLALMVQASIESCVVALMYSFKKSATKKKESLFLLCLTTRQFIVLSR